MPERPAHPSGEDSDATWADLVARLRATPDLTGRGGEPLIPAGRDREPLDGGDLDRGDGGDLDGRDWDGTEQYEAAEAEVDALEAFVPPEPGPVLGGDPLLTMAWLAVAGMPLLLLVVLVAWRSAPPVVPQAAGVTFLLGLAVLVWRMPTRRGGDGEGGDPGDNGAVV